jgi:hypothetical protein
VNGIEQLLANMTKAERNRPITRGELIEFTATTLRHMKALKQRSDAFEQRVEAFEQRIQQLEKGVRP